MSAAAMIALVAVCSSATPPGLVGGLIIAAAFGLAVFWLLEH